MIFFNLQVNLAGAPCRIAPTLPDGEAGPEPQPEHAGPLPLCYAKERIAKKKYVDDLSFLESINLWNLLLPLPPIIGPLGQHE